MNEGTLLGFSGRTALANPLSCCAFQESFLDVRKKEEMKGGERITLTGEIKFRGEDILSVEPSERAKKGIILCPERRLIFPESSALENLRMGGYLATKAQAKKTLEYVFNLFPELEKLKRRAGGFLSGGEQQMLAIGRALMAQPKFFFLMNLSSDWLQALRSGLPERSRASIRKPELRSWFLSNMPGQSYPSSIMPTFLKMEGWSPKGPEANSWKIRM